MSAGGRGPAGTGDRPLVSVVLPVRDAAPTLDAALASLASQTLGGGAGRGAEDPGLQRGAFEVIVVDDGSTDDSPLIAQGWASRDDRFRCIRTGPDGLVAALQRGLAAARGEYFARMDADDVARPDRLAAQADLLRRSPDLDGCGARVRLVPESLVTPRSAEYAAWLNAMTEWRRVARDIFVECPLAHPAFMFRTEALRAAGGYRDRGWPEDYDLLLRLWRRGSRFVAVPRVLLDWTIRPGRLSRTHPAYSLAAFRTCRVHHLRRSLLVGRSGVVIWGAGPTGKSLAREFQRQGVGVPAFVEVDPRKVGQLIHGARVLGVDEVAAGVATGWTGERGGRPGAPKGVPEEVPEDAADPLRGALHVGAVARARGRANVRAAVAGAGLREGRDFVAMA